MLGEDRMETTVLLVTQGKSRAHGKGEPGAALRAQGHAVSRQGPRTVCVGGTELTFARPAASMFLAPACSAYQCISA